MHRTAPSPEGTGQEASAGPRRGRHLDESRDPQILRAALELLAEEGYDRLTMDAVAARVHAGKATLYRRWPSKAGLVVDAVTCFDEDLHRFPADSGSLRRDLHEAFLGIVGAVDDFHVGLAAALIAAARRHPGLATLFEERFVRPRTLQLQEIFQRARERGEVAEGHDIELLAAIGPALVFQRLLMSCQPLTRGYVGRVIDEVILPLVANPISPYDTEPLADEAARKAHS